MADDRRDMRGKPVSGERRMNGGKPVLGERRMNGGKPVSGERRMNGGKPVSGEHRGNGGKPVSGEYRGNGGKPASGERRMNGGKPASADRRMNSGKPASNERRGNYGKPTPSAQRQVTPARMAAYKALRMVTGEGAYAGLALGNVLEEARISAADRALATSIFYGTLERMGRLDYALCQLMTHEPEARIRDILRMSAYQILYLERVPDNAVCDEAVRLTRAQGMENATGLVNGVLRNLLRRRDELAAPRREDGLERYLSIEYSLPEFACARLIGQYGADMAERILAWREGDGVNVRMNPLRTDEARFERMLSERGLEFERLHVPGAYRVRGMGAVDRLDMYRQGLFTVQGESSLMCARALAPKPGMRVLDACAAPGGKSTALAELMQGAGRVYACDIHAHRVELIRASARRLGLDNVRPMQQDASRFNSEWENSMDAVLCDVPCSGLGVMASKPDIKLSLKEDELDALPDVQLSILENCARYVKKGGALIYSTCTILEAENQAVVRKFLARHGEFELCGLRSHIPECFHAGLDEGMLTLLGCRDNVDGFFIARMVRK